MSIIIGIITSFLSAISGIFWKKSLDSSKLSIVLFNLFGDIIGLIIIYSLIYFKGINYNIFYDYKYVFLLFIAGFIGTIGSLLEINILKKIKVSKILPYSNFSNLFVIVLGFLLLYGNDGYTSITTLLISIFTVIIIMLFSIDFKTFGIDKDILLYIFIKFLFACSTIIIGKILFEYSTLDIFSILVIVYIIIDLVSNTIKNSNLITIFTQNKSFYKYRILSSVFGWTSAILSMFIIESSGVLVASLLSFITIFFSIFGMKIILGDEPTKKQILLAFLVIILIGIGYYFK